MSKFLSLFFLILFSLIYTTTSAQDLLRNYNLREIKVDQLTDNEIFQYIQQLQALGITPERAEQIAIAKGMPLSEIQKLKQRVLKVNNSIAPKTNVQPNISNQNRVDTTLLNVDTSKTFKPLIDPKIFGSELFNNVSLTFEPNLKIATPLNYELGPDDEVDISVYGVQEVLHSLIITPDGTITIPQVGQIKLAGLTIEEATKRIRNAMSSSVYSTLKTGSSKLTVTLGNIRSLHVTIIGANKPGNYTLTSLTTAFNALFVAGGPSQFGSFREIELVRNNRVYKKIDLYRFLVNGDQSDNITLKDNDVIRVPPYKTRVDIEGYVRRPGYFEMLPGESFPDLMKFCSGFSDSAYRASVKVTQFTERELKVKDITADSFSVYYPADGDFIGVEKVLQRYANRINISGAVFRPGVYELLPNMTVGDLIKKADGLTADAYSGRGQIFRLRDDMSKEIVSFNALSALNQDPIPLKREDSVVIRSIFDLRDQYYISIQGEVRNPGFFEYSENLTLKDILLQAGGLTDAAYPQRIEVARFIRRDTLTSQDVRSSEIIEANGMDDIASPSKNILLKPFDVITIRRKPGYLEMETVKVSGELQYPGPYVLEKREERVSDLIKRAGGFTPEAYIQGAYIKRYNFDQENAQIRKQRIIKIQQQLKDSTSSVQQDIQSEYDQIPLNIERLLAQPHTSEDVVLVARDELFVPKFNPQVKISGSVLFPTQIPYDAKYSLKDYLSSAGGVAEDGRKSKIYVLYANGKAASANNFLFFKSYPDIKPGTEIVVPAKTESRNKLSTGEIIGLSSAIASIAGVVIAILKL